MAKFDKIHTGELEDWLFHSYVHDSEIMKIESNCDTGDLRVILFNPIFRVRIELSFHDVEVVFAKKGGMARKQKDCHFAECAREFPIFTKSTSNTYRILCGRTGLVI